MPLRNQQPFTFAGLGVSDTLDATTGPQGALASAQNLVPARHTKAVWECRPARQVLTTFPGFTTPGALSAIREIGDVVYGLVASGRNPGFDEPFAYNLVTGTFRTVSGIIAGNVPASPPATGAWTPPQITQVGQRILVTSTGFPGGAFVAPFYATVTANTHNGSTTVDGYFPAAATIPVGALITGPGIPAATTVTAVGTINFFTTATGSQGSTQFTVTSAAGIVIGLRADSNAFAGALVTAIAGTTITINQTLGVALSGGSTVQFTGQTVTLSAAASSDNNNATLTVSQAGSLGVKFGWFDISGASLTVTGNIQSGSPIVGVADITALQPGFAVSGAGIPAGATIAQITNPTLFNLAGNTNGTAQMTVVVNFVPGTPPQGPVAGQTVTGPGMAQNTVVTVAPLIIGTYANSVTYLVSLSQSATGTFASNLYTFSGIFSVTLSANATATGSASLTVTGGTTTAPQWAGGDTTPNPLPSIPVGVTQRNGRAWFACGLNGIPFSDALAPCLRSNANQALNTGDGLAVTAVGPLGQISQLTSSVVEATIVFQNAAKLQVITGDQVTGDLRMNELPIDTGTNAPDSITPTTQGLAFVSPLGLRIIGFTSNVSEVIGAQGQGVALPFISAAVPSRIVAAAHDDAIRVNPGAGQEWWFHLASKTWSGPHTLDSTLLAPWNDPATGKATFITTSAAHPATLYRSDTYQTASSVFSEDGTQLNWNYATSLLPDNPEGHANSMVQSAIFFRMDNALQALATASDDESQVMDQVYVWQGPLSTPRQTQLAWRKALVFRQMTFALAGQSTALVLVGGLHLRYQRLGYQLPTAPAPEFILGQNVLGGAGVLGP